MADTLYKQGCPCFYCVKERANATAQPLVHPMAVCPTCGNKRCPKSTIHTLNCSGSNEPGQSGSRYTLPSITHTDLSPA